MVKKKILSPLLLSIMIFAGCALIVTGRAGTSHACILTTDCEFGSTCVKASGALYGVCVGGMFPGNRNDSQPASNALDEKTGIGKGPKGTYGNICSFDFDCGIGMQCSKSFGTGVCVPR